MGIERRERSQAIAGQRPVDGKVELPDPNASIPTPEPVMMRPMFGALGRGPRETAITFLSQAAIDDGVPVAPLPLPVVPPNQVN